MLIKFYTATIFGAITNREFEGEIKKYGDQLHIRDVADVTVRKYTTGQNLIRTRPTTVNVDLDIDQGWYYSIPINDVEKLQSNINYMERWTEDAGEQTKIAIDDEVLENIYADADT